MTADMAGCELARAAEALVGVSFRLHGRDPASGLDCVGVVTGALAACGRQAPSFGDYGLRNRSIAPLLSLAGESGLVPADGPLAAGDVILVRPGPAQHHLLIAAAAGSFVHAHAGLRRVVVQPGPLPWPITRRWRLAAKET